MAPVAFTVSKLSPNPDFTAGNKKFRFRAFVGNTGDYVADGVTVTAAMFGLKRFAALVPLGGFSKTTDFAVGWPVGAIRYNTERTSALITLLESAADGDPMDEKPAEAMVAHQASFMAIGH
jgi:hypothetical protein